MPKGIPGSNPPCSISGCPGVNASRGWCEKHYSRWKRHGDPLVSKTYQFPENLLRRLRFCPPTVLSTGCIEWTGATDDDGYGYSFMTPWGRLRPHQAAYVLAVGQIPEGKELDHLCRNPPCVHPGHLDPVTHRENVLRGDSPAAIHARKTHCVHGHEFTEENTYWYGNRRRCRACR